MERDVDVALSFAGEDRAVAEEVAQHLEASGVRVFLDSHQEAELWGKDLYQHLHYIYRDRATFCVIFVSRAYAEKLWTRHELKQAQARAFRENREYILPVRLDDTELPGLLSTVAHVDLRSKTPKEVSDLLVRKLEHVREDSRESGDDEDEDQSDDEPELLDLRVAIDDAFGCAMKAVLSVSQAMAAHTAVTLRRHSEGERLVAVGKRASPRDVHAFATAYASDFATLGRALECETAALIRSTDLFFDNLHALAQRQIRSGVTTRAEMSRWFESLSEVDRVVRDAIATYAAVAESATTLRALTLDFKRKRRRAVDALAAFREACEHWLQQSERTRSAVGSQS